MSSRKTDREEHGAGPGSERLKILFVDDDAINIESFVSCFSEEYEIFPALSGEEALEIFSREEDVAMVLSDQRMNEMTGVELLARVYELSPDTVRIIITGYMDVSDTIDAINKGHIYQFILKPWDIVQMRLVLEQASQTWLLTRENRQLSQQLVTKNRLLLEANQHLKDSENRLRHLSTALITAQEKERKRISMELHDEMGQSLAALKLQIKVIENELAGKEMFPVRHIHANLEHLRNTINEIIENVRRLSKNLSPVIIDDLGLDAAIENIVLSFTDIYGIPCNFRPEPLENRFSSNAQRLLYRLIQEALNNIGKHSRATKINFTIQTTEQDVTMILQDNGDGFDLQNIINQPASRRGIGLTAMSERVNMLGGTLDITSKQGIGTRVVFVIPFEQKTEDVDLLEVE